MYESMPAVPMGRNEFQVLVHIIGAYLAILRRQPLSANTNRQMDILVQLSVRITATFLHENPVEGLRLPMTVEEVSALQAAMRGFVTQLCRLVPQSPERNEAIAGIQDLGARLSSLHHAQQLN